MWPPKAPCVHYRKNMRKEKDLPQSRQVKCLLQSHSAPSTIFYKGRLWLAERVLGRAWPAWQSTLRGLTVMGKWPVTSACRNVMWSQTGFIPHGLSDGTWVNCWNLTAGADSLSFWNLDCEIMNALGAETQVRHSDHRVEILKEFILNREFTLASSDTLPVV